MRLRDLMVLDAKSSVTFRGQRMSRASRRGAATAEEGGAARAAGKNKPSTARLRKAGVNVPVKKHGKRAAALAKRRGKLAGGKGRGARKVASARTAGTVIAVQPNRVYRDNVPGWRPSAAW